MSTHFPRTYFFRPSRVSDAIPTLDPVVVTSNAANGIMTDLILDTNIVLRMEDVVKGGNKPPKVKFHGLHNLVSLLNRCPPQSITISPGLAFNEMPPKLAERARYHYESFCRRHLPTYVDTPDSIRRSFSGKSFDYGYLDLDETAQAVLAVPFISLIYLNIVDKTFPGNPIEKFKEYVRRLTEDLDLLYAAGVEIAAYSFSNPSITDPEGTYRRQCIRDNFIKSDPDNEITGDEIIKVAFNGASDLTLAYAANFQIEKGINRQKYDCWIATRDKKLAEFFSFFYYIDRYGEVGKYSSPSFVNRKSDDTYWNQATKIFTELSVSRAHYVENRKDGLMRYIQIAKKAINDANRILK